MKSAWKTIEIDISFENTKKAAEFVEKILEQEKCPVKIINQMLIAFDEIYSNIVKYSQAEKLELSCAVMEEWVYLSFKDDGLPYNPLEEKDPDINVSMKQRQIGGLGIFMVKQMMDDTTYQYKENHNIFTIGKSLPVKGEIK